MSKKIVGVTVGTGINVEEAFKKTAQAEQIEKNTRDIIDLTNRVMNSSTSVCVTNYGVTTINDGATNSANLQALIDTLHENGGGTIYIPSGTYTFASNEEHVNGEHCIRMKSNVHIYGDGTNTILKPTGHTAKGLDMFYFNDYVEKGVVNYLENCVFANFVVDGAETTVDSYTSSGKGFMINLFKDCYWKNVTVKNTIATGFGVDCPINSAMVDCYAENCGRGASTQNVGASGFGIGYGYSDKENFFMSNCNAKSNKKFGIFFEHQRRFDSTYKATNNGGFIVSECKAENNYCNFGGVQGINVQFKNCFSKLANHHGYIFENSDNCHALGCYSVMETDTSFVILSHNDNGENYEVKDVSFNQCISKYTNYGAKIVQYGTTADVTRNMIKDCFFDATITNSIKTSGTMKNLILFGNVSTGADNDFSATITDFVNENNSWNDVASEQPYAGQKLIAFGTSTVSRCDNVWEDNQWKDKYNGGYLAYLVEKLGFDNYTNEGVAGIPTMDMKDSSGTTVKGISSLIGDKLENVKNYDVIQIQCAGNDYLLEAPLGRIDSKDDLTNSLPTFASALKGMLEQLQALQVQQVAEGKKPIEIFVTLPTKTKRNNASLGEEEGKYHEDYVNLVGHKQEDYVDMCIKICNKYGVHVVDTYRNSGISPLNASVYLEDDGSHMNAKGYEVFGQTIAGVMKTHHGAVLSYEEENVEDTVIINGERYDLSNVPEFEYKMILNLGGTPYLYVSHAPMYFNLNADGKTYAETFVMYYTARAPKNANSNSFEPITEMLTTTQTPTHLQTLRLNTTEYCAWPRTTRDLDGLVLAANHDIKLWGSDEVLFHKKWEVNEESSSGGEVVEDTSADVIIRVEGSPYEEFTLDQCTIVKGDTTNILNSWKSGKTFRAEVHFYTNTSNFFGEAVVVPAEVTIYDEWIYLRYNTLRTDNYYKCHNSYFGQITLRNNAIEYVYFEPEYDLIIKVKHHGTSKFGTSDVELIEGNIISLAQKAKSGRELKAQVRLYKADTNYYAVECSAVPGRATLYGEWLNVYFTIPAQTMIFTANVYWKHSTGAFGGSTLYKCEGTSV